MADRDTANRQTKVISFAKLKELNTNFLSRAQILAAWVDQDHDYQAFLGMKVPVGRFI